MSRRRIIKFLLVQLACFCLGTTFSFAQPGFLTVASTPYDRQMTPVAPILNSSADTPRHRTSLAIINHWVASLRAIPYKYSYQWKTPAEVRSDLTGDCKGKAIVLYQILRAKGARHVRLVIGKHHFAAQRTHAWLEWETTRGTYLLDPTFNSAVERVNGDDPARYIPHYAYDGAHRYRAVNYRPSKASIVASN